MEEVATAKEMAAPTFRRLVDQLVTLLAYEATRDVRVEPCDITTPVAATTGVRLSAPKPMVTLRSFPSLLIRIAHPPCCRLLGSAAGLFLPRGYGYGA